MKEQILSIKGVNEFSTKESVLNELEKQIQLFNIFTLNLTTLFYGDEDIHDSIMINNLPYENEPFNKDIMEFEADVYEWMCSILDKIKTDSKDYVNLKFCSEYSDYLNDKQYVEEIKTVLSNYMIITSNLKYLFDLYSDFDELNELIKEDYPFKQSFEDFETDTIKWVTDGLESLTNFEKTLKK